MEPSGLTLGLVSFDVAATSYDRFMGRYSRLLSPQMADLAGLVAGDRVLDVGCGPGALLGELVGRLGSDAVAAVEPSEQFVNAARERFPGVRIEQAGAEALPFDDNSFDASLAQLVVHFMSDPVAGISELRRVTRPGGKVVACVWDFQGGRGPLSLFWDVARELDPGAIDESRLAGVRQGHLVELFEAAGLTGVEESVLEVTLEHENFDAWWEPYTAGVGPAGNYLASLSSTARADVRDLCRERLPNGAFSLTSRAWAAVGTA